MNRSAHEELVQAAVQAVNRVFEDRSAPVSWKIESMLAIIEVARGNIDALQADEADPF